MDEKNFLAEKFEENRPHLRDVAYRMLGSLSEADDAVQESWLRLSRSDSGSIENLGGWLTTVVARVCLDILRSRKSRNEESLDVPGAEPTVSRESGGDPESEVVMADSVGLALLVILNTLAPAERLAFVLHDMFDLSFEKIAPLVDRTPTAARQLASRARRRVQGADTTPDPDRIRQQEIVTAFLAASRNGDFEALVSVLDPGVVFRPDQTAARSGSVGEVHGAPAVARLFQGRAQGAVPALVDGALGIVVAPQGRLLLIIIPTITRDKIIHLEVVADPEQLKQMEIALLSN